MRPPAPSDPTKRTLRTPPRVSRLQRTRSVRPGPLSLRSYSSFLHLAGVRAPGDCASQCIRPRRTDDATPSNSIIEHLVVSCPRGPRVFEQERDSEGEDVEQAEQRRPDRRHAQSERLTRVVQGPDPHNPLARLLFSLCYSTIRPADTGFIGMGDTLREAARIIAGADGHIEVRGTPCCI